jgi:hypothetical protein
MSHRQFEQSFLTTMRNFVQKLWQMNGQPAFSFLILDCFKFVFSLLFDCVFQLLLDFLQPKQKLGYVFKSTPSVSTFIKAYADDLTLITRNTQDMQKAVALLNTWLTWTQTMKTKPSKCISIGFKMFGERTENEKFTPLSSTIYSPFILVLL